MVCCKRLSRLYLVVTNCLFASFGCALMVFGVMGVQHRMEASMLLPINVLKMLNILGIIVVFTAVIGVVGAFYRERQAIHVLYITVVLIALIYQLSTAAIVYDQAARTSSWLSQVWAESSQEYRLYIENKFSCCGFSHPMDHPVATPTCLVSDLVNSAPPCYNPLARFMKRNLQIVYIVLFSAISIELLALCNVMTLFCSRFIGQSDNDIAQSPESRHLRHHGRSSSRLPENQPPSMASLNNNERKQGAHTMIDSVISVSDHHHLQNSERYMPQRQY